MDNEYKEVYFHKFCKKCEYEKTENTKDPCDECLSNPTNLYSHKPVNWKKKSKEVNQK